MVSRRRARNPQGQGGRLRAELIAAADDILARAGDVEGLSLRAVAREVGIATPSIYLHFADKAALIDAVLDARFAELAAAVQAATADTPDPAARLRAGCLAYCCFATEHPNAYRVLFGRVPAPRETAPDPRPPEAPAGALPPRAVGASTFGILVESVADCMRAGAAPPADPHRVATGVWTALHGIVSLRGSVPGFPWPPLEQQVDDILAGLARLRHNPPGSAG